MKRRIYLSIIGAVVIIACASLILIYARSSAGILSERKTSQFQSFPIGKKVAVQLELDMNLRDELSSREKFDQARDWLLYTILSDAGLTADEYNKLTYDLPVTRQTYNRNVYNLDYGKTRSRYIGNGSIAAIIPAGSQDEQIDFLTHIADEQRKNLGELPKWLQVFEYVIDSSCSKASVVRTKIIDAKDLFTTKYGYNETAISGVDDLKRFLEQNQDISFASFNSEKLVLGGRKLKGRSYKNIKLEDIAAIWQSEKSIEQKKNEFDERWSHRTYTTQAEREALETERYKDWKDSKIVNGSGFSLDPVYDYQRLISFFQYARPGLSYYVDPSQLQDAEDALDDKNEGPLLDILSKLEQTGTDKRAIQISKLFQQIMYSLQIQKARYDGELQGTEVGMHLFYTDLLAKLWCINYEASSPEKIIPDFVNSEESAVRLAKIYEQEAINFPSARLWFGPNSLGYQVVSEGNALLFARNATKIYSASSNPLSPGKEVETSAQFDASLDWWNNHYEEVAAYEQEYEALNEIMKWSLLIGWLNANYRGSELQFLQDVKVSHENWFPDWIKKQPNLKFTKWDHITFYKKGYKGLEQESMPLLRSPGYIDPYSSQRMVVSGGVSLAEKKLLSETAPLRRSSTNELIRRSNLDYSSLGDGLKSLKGNTFEFVNAGSDYKVISKASESAKLRSKSSEIGNYSFERGLSKSGNNLSMKLQQNGVDVGELATHQSGSGFQIGFKGRDLDKGQTLAKRLSDATDPQLLLSQRDDVEKFITIDKGKQYAIKATDSDKWMLVKLENEPEVFLSESWHSRVSGNLHESKICSVKWLDETAVLSSYGNKYPVLKGNPLITKNEWVTDFKGKEYGKILERVDNQTDVDAIKKTLSANLKSDLKRLDQVTDKAQYNNYLDEFIANYGKTPELKFRKGLSLLQDMKYNEAELWLNRSVNGISKGKDAFYNEVNVMLKNSKITDRNKELLQAFIDFETRGNKKVIQVSLERLPEGEKVDISNIRNILNERRTTLLVQRNPSLNNIDWNVKIEQSGSVIGLPEDAILIKIDRTSLADYRLKLKAETRPDRYTNRPPSLPLNTNGPSDSTSAFSFMLAEERNNNYDASSNRDIYVLCVPDKLVAKS